MSFGDILYAVTGAFGWVVIALAAVTLAFVLAGYLKTAIRIQRSEGWPALWQAIRKNVLNRKRRR